MEEAIDSKKALYRNALPDFISLFWAYCRTRMHDGVSIIHPGYAGKNQFYSELQHASDFVVEVDIHIQMALEELIEEFYILLTKENKSFVMEIPQSIPTKLEERYGSILRQPLSIQIARSIETYLTNQSKLRGYELVKSRHFKVANTGLYTAADATTWAAILKYALGDEFNIRAFLRVAASVDIIYAHDLLEAVGVVTQRAQQDHNDRSIEALDPINKSYINSEVVAGYTLRNTQGCPAMFQPSEAMQTFIAQNFPGCEPKETMIDGLARVIPKAIRDLIADFIEENGLESFKELIEKQEPILKHFLEKGFTRETIAELTFK